MLAVQEQSRLTPGMPASISVFREAEAGDRRLLNRFYWPDMAEPVEGGAEPGTVQFKLKTALV